MTVGFDVQQRTPIVLTELTDGLGESERFNPATQCRLMARATVWPQPPDLSDGLGNLPLTGVDTDDIEPTFFGREPDSAPSRSRVGSGIAPISKCLEDERVVEGEASGEEARLEGLKVLLEKQLPPFSNAPAAPAELVIGEMVETLELYLITIAIQHTGVWGL